MNFQIYFRHVMHLWCEHFCFSLSLTINKHESANLFFISVITVHNSNSNWPTKTGMLIELEV